MNYSIDINLKYINKVIFNHYGLQNKILDMHGKIVVQNVLYCQIKTKTFLLQKKLK